MDESRTERYARWTLRRERRRWELMAMVAIALVNLALAAFQDTLVQAAFLYVAALLFLMGAAMGWLQRGYRSIILRLEAENARLRAPHSAS